MEDEMFIESLLAREKPRAALFWMRALARGCRRPPRRHVKTPEYRALDQIVADAEAAGYHPVVVGPSGILEIRDSGVTVRPMPVDVEPLSLT